MSRAALLARARAAAERGMRDRCTIRRRTGETNDSVTAVTVPTYLVLYTDQRCRVQQNTDQAQEREVGETHVLLWRGTVQLPLDVTGLKPDDEIVMTLSEDPDLPGRTLVVRDLAHKTDASSRRVGVIERS
jgi:hypothetical protein